MASRASTCSVTFMVPNSAAMAEPALAATIRAVNTGPSSRVMDRATPAPNMLSPPNLRKP